MRRTPRMIDTRGSLRPVSSRFIPMTTGWYRVLVRHGHVKVTSTGRRLITLDLEVVQPYEQHGRHLFDVVVPHSGEVGEVQRERVAGYGVPQFIIDDYMGGGLLPVGNEAGLALVAAELTGRTAWVLVRPWSDPVTGGRPRNEILRITQQAPEVPEVPTTPGEVAP